MLVTWNSAEIIANALESLERLERPPSEVIVVDNASRDGTAELVAKRFPSVTLVESPTNTGFCSACNEGIRRSTSPFVLFLNPDAVATPRFVEELLPAFDDPSVGMAGGKLLRLDRVTLDSAGQLLGRSRQPIDRGYGEVDRGLFEDATEVFGICGAAALCRRDMLESIADPGGAVFDDVFFAYYEDLDVAWRARKLGWKAVYQPRAVGYHQRGSTVGGGGKRWRALLERDSRLRFHILKNRYLAILRNDSPGDFLRNLPWIAARDLGTLAIVTLTSPSVLVRLWKERAVFRRAIELGRADRRREPHTK